MTVSTVMASGVEILQETTIRGDYVPRVASEEHRPDDHLQQAKQCGEQMRDDRLQARSGILSRDMTYTGRG